MGSFSGIVLVVLHSTRKPVMSSILSHVVHFEVEFTLIPGRQGDRPVEKWVGGRSSFRLSHVYRPLPKKFKKPFTAIPINIEQKFETSLHTESA